MSTHSLDALVGYWDTTGESVPDEKGRVIAIRGMDKYEWLPGRKFLVHYADVWMGEEKANVVEVIGPCAEDLSGIPMHSFEGNGQHAVMHAKQQKPGEWVFSSEDLRATLIIGQDGSSMTARWDRKIDGQRWNLWLTMRFTKRT